MASKSVIGRESAALVLEPNNVLIVHCIRKRYSLFIMFKVCIFYSSHSCCWLRELEEVSDEYDSYLAPDNDYTSCLFIALLSLHVQTVNLSSTQLHNPSNPHMSRQARLTQKIYQFPPSTFHFYMCSIFIAPWNVLQSICITQIPQCCC